MKIRMKVHLSGTRNGVRWPAVGGDVDVTDGEAVDLIGSGLAEAVPEAPKPERATVKKKPETRKGR